MSTTIVEGTLPVTGSVLDNYVTFDHVPILPRVALWDGHLFYATVTGWVGEGGSGKGLTGIDVGSRVVTGALMPLEREDTTRDRSPGRVIGVWPEDDANEDLAPRWQAALRNARPDITDEELKTALSLVTNMTETLDDDPFTLGKSEESIATMRAVIDCYAGPDKDGNPQIPVTFVVIDPLLAVTDESLSTNRAARRVVGGLMRLAKETGVAIMLTHHTTKDGKVAGSKGLTDVLRLIFMAEWDKANDGVVILRKEKGNNIGKVQRMRYRMDGTALFPHLAWVAPPQQQQQQQQAPPPKPKTGMKSSAPSWRTRVAPQRPSQQIWK